jgi:hypothetical protein
MASVPYSSAPLCATGLFSLAVSRDASLGVFGRISEDLEDRKV